MGWAMKFALQKVTHRVHREKTLSLKTLRPCAYIFNNLDRLMNFFLD